MVRSISSSMLPSTPSSFKSQIERHLKIRAGGFTVTVQKSPFSRSAVFIEKQMPHFTGLVSDLKVVIDTASAAVKSDRPINLDRWFDDDHYFSNYNSLPFNTDTVDVNTVPTRV
jgi:hypothetical protein